MASAPLGVVFLVTLSSACSLSNVHRDDCTSDSQCELAFGTGSKCSSGFCTQPTNPGCEQKGANGVNCFSCAPSATPQFENACTAATCQPFDNKKRLTKLNADGSLPPLP